MNRTAGPSRDRKVILARALGIALLTVLAACGDGAPPRALHIDTLSTRADMVTNGDVLVQVSLSGGLKASAVRITRNNVDVTARFKPSADGQSLRGLVDGLVEGPNTLVAAETPYGPSTSLPITNHPRTGPVFSGPKLTPFECRTVQSGLGAPLDANCSATTQTNYFYMSTAGPKPLADATGPRPSDLVTTTLLDGRTVPYIVRVESGTINRSIYRIAVIDDPKTADTWNNANWNGRVVFRFGESTGAQYNQGVSAATFGDVFSDYRSDKALKEGYAYIVSTLNVHKINPNDPLSAETVMMIKEHFIENYGIPRWMVGWGGSGGAIQQLLIAQNYPGLLDGILPEAAFPDAFGTAQAVSDCRLLNRYFMRTPGSSNALRQAFQGFTANNGAIPGANDTCAAWDVGNGDAIVANGGAGNPGCGLIDTTKIYNATTNPTGARCTLQDVNINTFGADPANGFARRPLDNVGIQYGLAALRAGKVTADQFLDLNAGVGGYDVDGNLIAQRTVGTTDALQRAYELGRIGGIGPNGLGSVPILTARAFGEVAGDIHTLYNDIQIREKLKAANGRADNHAVWVLPNPALAPLYGVSKASLDALAAQVILSELDVMQAWLDGITADPAPLTTDKVVKYKPAQATDGCWKPDGTRIDETATLNDPGVCNTFYPKGISPRMAAGGPIMDDVLKCQLKPVSMALTDDTYGSTVTFSDTQKTRLASVFANGVCDYSKPAVGRTALKGTWLRF